MCPRHILLAVAAGLALADASIVTLALPQLLHELDTTVEGVASVLGVYTVVLAATLAALPAIPAIGLVLILSIDWFMGIARALGNYVGNCVATVVVATWDKAIPADAPILGPRAVPVLASALPTAVALAEPHRAGHESPPPTI